MSDRQDSSRVLHENEIPIDTALVRQLLNTQFPDYGALTIERLPASGSTNALFKLGDHALARLPRQPGGGEALLKERRWTAEVTEGWSLAVPQILELGQPSPAFAEHWAIVTWLPGEHPPVWQAGTEAATQSGALARDLADVIHKLRDRPVSQTAAEDPALRWYRGEPLSNYDRHFCRTLSACRAIPELDVNLDNAEALWERALAIPATHDEGSDRWFHSDLVAENLLLRDGRLTAVLDFGTLSVGDPCIDLHGAWELFDPEARAVFRERLGVNDAEWQRGRAWALAISLGALSYYWHTMPGRRHDRLAMLRSALADTSDD